MAGCYGNTQEDRYYEKELGKYLDEQDSNHPLDEEQGKILCYCCANLFEVGEVIHGLCDECFVIEQEENGEG